MTHARRGLRAVSTAVLIALGMTALSMTAPGLTAPASAALIGSLSGTVTAVGAPLPRVWVVVTPVREDGNAAGAPTRVLTDSAGRYELPEVYWQAVKVQARAPALGEFVDTYWPGRYSFGQAGVVEISSWPVRIDIDLPRGGSVQGTVIDRRTGAPVPDARVAARMIEAATAGSVGTLERPVEPGGFRLVDLPPVAIRLVVGLPAGATYLEPAYDLTYPMDTLRIDGARTTTALPIALRRGAEIRGTVRNDLGEPVAGVEVQVTPCRPACPAHAWTDDVGRYRIRAIPPGSDLRAYTPGSPDLLAQWYRGAESQFAATPFTLESGDVADDVDFELTRGGFVNVRILAGDTGMPLVGAIVSLVSRSNLYNRHLGTITPEDPSNQTIGPAPPGEYVLGVRPGTSNPGYLPVAPYTDAASAQAGVLELTGGQTRDLVVRLPARAAAGADAGAGARTGDRAGPDAASGLAPGNAVPAIVDSQPWPGLATGFRTSRPWPLGTD